MRKIGGLFLLYLVAAAATAESKEERLQEIFLGVKVPVGVRRKDQFGEVFKIPGSVDVDVRVGSGMTVPVGGGVDTIREVYGENIWSRSDVRSEAGDARVWVKDAGALEVQDGDGVKSGEARVDVQDTSGVEVWRKPSDKKVRIVGIKGRYPLRKKREAAEKEVNDEEGAASGEEGDVVEELPEPEGLAWINPMRLASQGVAVETVPSLANLLGLQVVKYREPQPPFHRPQGHPRRSPTINQQFPGTPASKPFSRFDSGMHPFGNSFHDSFDRYYKSFNRKDLPGGSSYSRPPPQPSASRIMNGGGRPYQPPANTFPRSPYLSLSDSLLQLLDPFNLFGHNQFPQLPRYPLPPPNYYTHRKQPFQPAQATGPLEAEVKNIRDPEAKYEIIVDPNQENHKGYQFREDYPLRDDLYIGQDGNIYLKEDSVVSKNNPQQKESGQEETPSHSPTLRGQSNSVPRRPQPTHPTSPPRGQFQEDIGNFDYDSGDEYEEDLHYVQLLKNHNMDEYFPNDLDPPTQNTVPDSYRNSPQTPRRPPTRFDEHYPNNGLTPGVAHNPYLVHTPTNSISNYGFLRWLFPSYGRLTSPNYFYNPREILLPRFQYPGGSWSGPGVPTRTGTRLNLSGTNYKQVPPLPSHPRAPVHNPSLSQPSRPPPRNPSLRPALRNPSPSYPPVRRPPGSRGNTHHRNVVQDSKGPSNTKFEGAPGRGDGFYPGNGFFHSDFPTLFHMSPSQKYRAVAQLPRPLAQNATAPADQQQTDT